MELFGGIERDRKTAIYIRISTSMQQTDRQREELLEIAHNFGIQILENDIFTDIISGFKEGEKRPRYLDLMKKVNEGVYKQILISEFSRLDRKPSNLLKSIEYFQKKDVYLYFKKQGLCVKDKTDISTQIMISVLAVMSQYEIELFTSRGIDGKIIAIKNRGINQGGFTAYGYSSNAEKKLVINEEEASVVRRIFAYYIDGKSTLEIADILNSENIPSPYVNRIAESNNKRKQKGLPIKGHKFKPEDLIWRATTISRLVKNELYIGKRKFTFHEPEPANPLPSRKREKRTIFKQFEQEEPTLAIIDERIFFQVKQIIENNRFNKNLGLRHDNLLKPLLKCGECGSNYSVSGDNKNRKYKCFGTINRTDKKRICQDGTEVQMARLDGLVLQLCIQMFASYDMEAKAKKKIEDIEYEITSLSQQIENNEKKITSIRKEYDAEIRRIISLVSSIDEEEAQKLVEETKLKKDEKENTLITTNEKAKANRANLEKRKDTLLKMKNSSESIIKRQYEIKNDKSLVREYIAQFIEDITLYRMTKLWSLAVVHLIDGGEFWGSLKSARYKKEEMFYDSFTCSSPEYKSWFLNNSEHCFMYDKVNKTITYNGKSEIYTKSYNGIEPIKEGVYSPMEFDDELTRTEWMGSFPPYIYEK